MERNMENKNSKIKFLLKINICFVILFMLFLVQQCLTNGFYVTLANSDIETRNNEAISDKAYTYLSDINYVKDQSSVGWGNITLDKNLDTKYNSGLITLNVDGQQRQFLKGIAAHATSTLVYDLTNYNYDYFTSYIGVDASRGSAGNGVKFLIYTSVDGENWDLKTSETPQAMKGNSNAQFVKIDIKGAKYLKLYAHNNGNADGDHSVYANAKLIKEDYIEQELEPADFIKTVEEYDEIIKTYEGQEITGDYELLILQREFVKNVGYDMLMLYSNHSEEYRQTVSWLFNNVENLRLYILGGKPEGSYMLSLKVLNDLYQTYKSDFEIKEVSKYGTIKGELYKKMAITLSLTHSQLVGLWMQSSKPENQSNAVIRYEIFKKMYNEGNFVVNENIDINKWFESYNIEEMRFVLNNNIDDEEILWLNEYTQSCIDAHPNQVWTYLTPHPYMAYVWPNYSNPVFHDPDRKDYWDEKFGGIFSKYGVTYSTPDNMIYKVWMNFRNEFGTGAVCGGISKTGSNIRTSHGIPAAVIGQPGHAAIIYYSKDDNGNGYWNLDNDVSGWTLSEKGERMLLGWGNASYSRGYSVVYMALAQEALNDYENFEKCEKLVMLANSYSDDLEKQEEVYRKALEAQPINIDAWYGLINTYNLNENKTENDYFDLAEELAENLKYFPLPMQHLTNLIKPKLTSIENSYRFTLLQTRILTEGSQTPNNTADDYYVYQPSLTRLEANYLLGKLDKTIATFSFDGEDNGKIVLASRFDGNGVRWDYSLDGKQTWKEVSFNAEEEHKWQLTDEEINSITSENDIYIHIVGVNYNEENLYKIDIQESAGLPATLYANDLENKLIAAIPAMQWKFNEEDEWTSYSEEEPDLTGNKSVIVRVGATGTYLASNDSTTFNFTEDNIPNERKYIPISHLSIHSVSSEATAQGRHAKNAIDGNIKTNWHSAWNGSDRDKFIVIKLDETKTLTALEYFPIASGNGKIESAQILVSQDGENWTEVVSGTDWKYNNTNDTTMKSVEFDPIKAQYIKIVGKKTQSASSSSSFIVAGMFNLYENTTVKMVANFSFDGELAKQIVLEDEYKNLSWEYSVDGGTTWKNGLENKHLLTENEINCINENDKIKVRLDGDETEYIINIKKGKTPETASYLNDWENKLIGQDNVETLEWKIEGDSDWTSYEEQEPVVLGNNTLLVRTKAKGIYTASDSLEYSFTEDNYPDDEKYIPISHLSIHDYSTQSVDTSRPFYATNAIDGNRNTIWHTDFRESIADSGAYITLKLDNSKNISGLEFVQTKYKSNNPDYIKNAIVYISENGEEWVEAGRIENCEQNEEFKKIKFDDSIYGQYVKLELEGYEIFASVAMINLYEDKTKEIIPTASIEYSNTELTNQNVVATLVNPNTEIIVTNNDGNMSYTFTENGEFTFEFRDKTGNTGSVTAVVDWIDKTAPTAQINYNITEATQENVIATLVNASEEIIVTNNNGNMSYTFTENGEFTFEFRDKAGNTGSVTAKVNWINKNVDEEFIFNSEKYKINEGYISNIVPETTIRSFKQNVETNQELVFTDKNGNQLNENDIIGTGTKIKVGNKLEYTLVVIGDIDGNGKISTTDSAKLKLHQVEMKVLTGAELMAADVDGNGKVSSTDLAQIKLVIVGLKK